MRSVEFDKRKSGISLIGDLPWGSHFCQFYQTKKDLLETLVPYFKAGLENNEFCIWIISPPLEIEDAGKALKKYLPHFEKYLKNGQLEIISYAKWRADAKRAEEAIDSMLDKAVFSGFDGLRLASNAFPERDGSNAFVCYGVDAITRHNAIASFAYPRDEFDAIGLMDVVKLHRLALVRNAGRWEAIESREARIVKDALRINEEKMRSVFSNMSEGFAYHRIVLDEKENPCDYIFLEVNEAFHKITGLKEENIIGKRVTKVLPGIENDPAGWIGKYGKVALTGKPAHFESYSEALKKWYSVSAFSPHKGYFAVTFSDITERKLMEEKLIRSNENLQQFAYVASHDLQEPLRVMSNYSQLLQKRYKDKLGKDADDFIAFIVDAAMRMQNLILDLLSYSRIGRFDTERREVDCNAVLGKVILNLRSVIEESRALVTHDSLPVSICNDTNFMQLFQNLISNAIKFRRDEPPRVHISCRQEAGEWIFSVRDNGMGIEEQDKERIFLIFQRLHPRDKYPGTGIGLSICKKIVENYGGRIWVESELGKGSTFYFAIPVTKAAR